MDEKICCYDINGNAHECNVSDLIFRPTVYGLILEGQKILMVPHWDGYNFPGGGIEKGETIKNALRREVFEETGLDIKIHQSIHCFDNFFWLPVDECPVQAIILLYVCSVTGGKISTEHMCSFEKEVAGKACWMDIKNLMKIKLYNSVNVDELITRIKGDKITSRFESVNSKSSA